MSRAAGSKLDKRKLTTTDSRRCACAVLFCAAQRSAVIRFLTRCRRCRGMNPHALDEALMARKPRAETVTSVAPVHMHAPAAMHLAVAFL